MVEKRCLLGHRVLGALVRDVVQGRSQTMKGLNVKHTEFKLDPECNIETLKGSKQKVNNVAT